MGFDGHDYEIYFWDGSNVIQLSDSDYDDWNPRIDSGQTVWYGSDGYDWEIYYADLRPDLKVNLLYVEGSLALLAATYGRDEDDPLFNSDWDFIFDRVIDTSDLKAFAPCYGRTDCSRTIP